MEKARIFLIEDNEKIVKALSDLLEDTGHNIVLQASTLKEVTTFIESGELERCAVNVVFIDNVFPSEEGGPECYNGFLANKAIKKRNKNIGTIAFTNMIREVVYYGDHYLEKPVNSQEVFDAIAAV